MLEVLSKFAAGGSELANEGVKQVSPEVPVFAKDLMPSFIRNFKEANEPLYIKTINEDLAGQEHPVTGVPFVEKEIKTKEGTFRGVFPEFPVTYEMKLEESQYLESDPRQFREATNALKQEIELNPDLRSKFTDRQIEQIENGKVPEGYVWHHNEQPGVMQLADRETHDSTAHTGGRSIWGGGSEYR